jgi:hypothetical protein
MFQAHANRLIREAQRCIDDERARLQRMIVQGSPTQSADDRLNKLCETLRQLRSANARLPPSQPWREKVLRPNLNADY